MLLRDKPEQKANEIQYSDKGDIVKPKAATVEEDREVLEHDSCLEGAQV